MRNFNPDFTTEDGSTLLHKAAFFGYADVCRVLLDKGLNAGRKGKVGKTPIDIAAETGRSACVEILSGMYKEINSES